MNCLNCYQEIPDGTKFCPYCGAKQAESVAPESTENIRREMPPQPEAGVQPEAPVQLEVNMHTEMPAQPQANVQPEAPAQQPEAPVQPEVNNQAGYRWRQVQRQMGTGFPIEALPNRILYSLRQI